jgi:hypothetical protein
MIDSATRLGTVTAPALALDGTLGITLANSYLPPVGQSFVIMSGDNPLSTLSGTFANIEGQTFNNGTEKWDVQYTQSIFGVAPAEVILTAEPNIVPEPSLVALTGVGLAGIVAWSKNRRRSRGLGPDTLTISFGVWLSPSRRA